MKASMASERRQEELNLRFVICCVTCMETGISSVFFLFERLGCHNNLLLTEQEGPTGYYHMTRTAARVIS